MGMYRWGFGIRYSFLITGGGEGSKWWLSWSCTRILNSLLPSSWSLPLPFSLSMANDALMNQTESGSKKVSLHHCLPQDRLNLMHPQAHPSTDLSTWRMWLWWSFVMYLRWWTNSRKLNTSDKRFGILKPSCSNAHQKQTFQGFNVEFDYGSPALQISLKKLGNSGNQNCGWS